MPVQCCHVSMPDWLLCQPVRAVPQTSALHPCTSLMLHYMTHVTDFTLVIMVNSCVAPLVASGCSWLLQLSAISPWVIPWTHSSAQTTPSTIKNEAEGVYILCETAR